MLTGVWFPKHTTSDWKPLHYVLMAHVILDHKRQNQHPQGIRDIEEATDDEELCDYDPRSGTVGQPYNVYIRGAYYVWIRGRKTWFTVLQDSNGNTWTIRH